MKLVWHIFLKDLRRLALALLAWGGLFVLQFVGYRVLNPLNGQLAQDAVPNTILKTLWLMQWVAAWILVAFLVQDDPLLTDRAAWRTRPISGARLLTAKLLGLGVMFGAWPALLTLPWWLELGFDVGQILRLLLTTVLGMGAFAGVAAAVASLTPDLLRFLGWSFVLAVGAALTVFSISANLAVGHVPPGTAAVLAMRLALAAALALIGAGAILALQYLRRRWWTAVTLAGATAVATGVVAWAWPWSAATLREALTGSGAAKLRSEVRALETTLFVPPEPRAKAALQVGLGVTTENLGASDNLWWHSLEGTLRHGENGRLPLHETLQGGGWWSGKTRSVAETLLQGHGSDKTTVTNEAWLRLDLSPAMLPRLRAGDVALTGATDGALWRGELLAQMPLREGAADSVGLEVTRLVTIRPTADDHDGGHYIKWLEAGPLLVPDRLLSTSSGNANTIARRQSEDVVLGRNAALTLLPAWELEHNRATALLVGAVALTARFADYHPDTKSGNAWGEPADPARFADATFGRMVFREVAPVATPLTLKPLAPDLVIEGDLERARQRASAEGKRLLMIAEDRPYDPVAQKLPPGWQDLHVYELLRQRFVCVQVFAPLDPRFARRWREESFPKIVVWARDGTVQDVWEPQGMPVRWQDALTMAENGGTLVAQMRATLAQKGGGDRNERRAFAQALLGRGEVREGVEELLRIAVADLANARAMYDGNAVIFQLAGMAEDSPEVRTVLREARESAIAELKRSPRDPVAVWRLLATTSALRDSEAWAAFPQLLPRENPLRWELLASWVARPAGRNVRPPPPDAVDWEEIFHEGQARARTAIAEARRTNEQEYRRVSARWRSDLLTIGVRSVEALARGGETERAQRLAREVMTLAGHDRAGSLRWQLDRILPRRGPASR